MSTLIKNVFMVNEGNITLADLRIKDGFIEAIGNLLEETDDLLIDGTGKYLFPGIIDGQVHFREPGLTHKGDLYTESRAAVAGGVTSFIDMPNTFPNVLTLDVLAEKYQIAAEKSLANFGFLLGVNGDNVDEVCKMDTSHVLAVSDDGLYFTKKGNLLADNPETMEKLFSKCSSIIAIPVAGVINNWTWKGNAVSGVSDEMNYRLVSENPDVDFFLNPKYNIGKKAGGGDNIKGEDDAPEVGEDHEDNEGHPIQSCRSRDQEQQSWPAGV
jgi:hypothetical protein